MTDWLDTVAPYTGAWIEIGYQRTVRGYQSVAPYTGAWIEIAQTQVQSTSVQEQPAHESAHAVQEQIQEAVPAQTRPAPTSDFSPLIPQSLRDLMTANQVTQDEVLQATYVNGIYPLGTQVEAIDAGYWEYMVTVWDKVLSVIETKVRTNPEMPFTVEGN